MRSPNSTARISRQKTDSRQALYVGIPRPPGALIVLLMVLVQLQAQQFRRSAAVAAVSAYGVREGAYGATHPRTYHPRQRFTAGASAIKLVERVGRKSDVK